jgi:ribonucleoside-diphosphate reductase beta chain
MATTDSYTVDNTGETGILNPGFALTLRPMLYPQFYDHFINAQKNTWTVQEVSFSTDVADLRDKLSPAELHVVRRIIAFFATGDTVVANNACLTLYKHVNSPEYRMYMGRQIFEESLHIQAYLTLLDNYLPDMQDRFEAFAAINNIPSIKTKADFCFKWMDAMDEIDTLDDDEKKRTFLLNLITFAAAVEGLFFYGAFAYVYYLRAKGVLNGLGDITNWVFRDESMHMEVAFDLVDVVKEQYPHLWDARMEGEIVAMLTEAISAEMQFANETLSLGVAGLSPADMESYLKFCADQRLGRLGIKFRFGGKNNFPFMDFQDLDPLTNFFERRPTNYQIGIAGEVRLDDTDF